MKYTALLFIEQRNGVIRTSSLHLWNRLLVLAASHPTFRLVALLIGEADVAVCHGALVTSAKLLHANHSALTQYDAERYAHLITQVAECEGVTSLFFADTVLSRELAPKVSLMLDAALISRCSLDDGIVIDGSTARTLYAGSVKGLFKPLTQRALYTVIPSSSLPSETYSASPHMQQVDYGDDRQPAILSPFLQALTMRESALDITEASVVVAGGRGMGSAESFEMLTRLASLLGGAVGASRQAVDVGWRPHSEQIGQTGKSIAPTLYVACGISGSPQHLAGISGAGTIIAINSDPHAPIFSVAHYGFVGDLHTVLPVLISSLQELLQKK